jgi:hypothetical protein
MSAEQFLANEFFSRRFRKKTVLSSFFWIKRGVQGRNVADLTCFTAFPPFVPSD